MEARKAYNKTEKEAKRQYDTKLRHDLADRNISNKKWWQIVSSLAGKPGHSEIPVIVVSQQ